MKKTIVSSKPESSILSVHDMDKLVISDGVFISICPPVLDGYQAEPYVLVAKGKDLYQWMCVYSQNRWEDDSYTKIKYACEGALALGWHVYMFDDIYEAMDYLKETLD